MKYREGEEKRKKRGYILKLNISLHISAKKKGKKGKKMISFPAFNSPREQGETFTSIDK